MSSSAARPGASTRLPSRSRERRSSMTVLALLLILLGALGSALLVYRSGERVEALKANHDIAQGQRVTKSDFDQVRVAVDDGGVILQPAQLQAITAPGVVTSVKIPSGSLVTANHFVQGANESGERVGISIPLDARPAESLRPGDIVRVLQAPPSNGEGQTTELVSAARVVDVPQADETGTMPGARDSLHITVLVPADKVDEVIGASTTGRVAIALLPGATKPLVDLDGSTQDSAATTQAP